MIAIPIAIEAPGLIGTGTEFLIEQTAIEMVIVCQIARIADQTIRVAIDC
jgi:hypothetical protein